MISVNRQQGATLIEIMIGLALSMIVTASMVGLMGNSMGSATRLIQMTQLNDELRNAMSMVTRDVRRANYSAWSAFCYANPNCESITTVSDVNIQGAVGDADQCVSYNLDREQNNFVAADASPGAFRRVVVGDVGVLEMWVGGNVPNCDAAPSSLANALDGAYSGWLPVTDPTFVDITTFVVERVDVPNISVVEEDDGIVNQKTNTLTITLGGELRLHQGDAFAVSKEIQDTIRVRNDFIWRTLPAG